MIEILLLALSLACGMALGIIYFGGLWLTLQRLTTTGRPAVLALGSFLLRSGACILGFYLLSGNGLEGLACGLAGFVLAKVALIHRWGFNADADAGTDKAVD
ncbi:MAG TPA: ATP synthase subunit I [Methanotrichaceae archaeon]|nr:ATP synthase subunit I [Methanotrichaceae archaeon]